MALESAFNEDYLPSKSSPRSLSPDLPCHTDYSQLIPSAHFEVDIRKYNRKWPSQAIQVMADIAADLKDGNVAYLDIIHVGSTSVPFLAAKPILDILVIIEACDFKDIIKRQFVGALGWGSHPGSWKFNGDGGVKDRWSFSLHDAEPRRSLNVVAKGSMVLRSYLDVRDQLRSNPALRDEYAQTKKNIAKRTDLKHMRDYSILKNEIIRKILKCAGWSDVEVDQRQNAVATFTPILRDSYLP